MQPAAETERGADEAGDGNNGGGDATAGRTGAACSRTDGAACSRTDGAARRGRAADGRGSVQRDRRGSVQRDRRGSVSPRPRERQSKRRRGGLRHSNPAVRRSSLWSVSYTHLHDTKRRSHPPAVRYYHFIAALFSITAEKCKDFFCLFPDFRKAGIWGWTGAGRRKAYPAKICCILGGTV